MRAQIVILGWGSLLWDVRPEFDDEHEAWELDGPELSRVLSGFSVSAWRFDPTCNTAEAHLGS
jgi:hypothetical protein